MAQSEADAEKGGAVARRNDVTDVLGHLDDIMVAIMALKPTIADVEEASM